jgi:hypothetical protein
MSHQFTSVLNARIDFKLPLAKNLSQLDAVVSTVDDI